MTKSSNIIDTPSPNHGPRTDGTVVDMLVLHYTGMADAASALERLTDPGFGSKRALYDRRGWRGPAPGLGRSPRLACRRRVLAGPYRHQRPFDRDRAGQSWPRFRLPAVRGTADGGANRARRPNSSHDTQFPRAMWSVIRTWRRCAKSILASCSTGRASRRRGSAFGRQKAMPRCPSCRKCWRDTAMTLAT